MHITLWCGAQTVDCGDGDKSLKFGMKFTETFTASEPIKLYYVYREEQKKGLENTIG